MFTNEQLEQIRGVVREELDATIGLQEDIPEPDLEDVPWMFRNADGAFNVKALYSENQLRQLEQGRVVRPSEQALIIYHRSASAVRDGKFRISSTPSGRKLRQFMLDNPDIYGTDWVADNPE